MVKNKVFNMLFSVFIVLFLLTITACKNNDKPAPKDYEITHEEEFGGIYIKSTIDDFNNLGFEYGDSVDIVFSNGKELKDIPYYNGYYTQNGEKLLVAYPGYPYIKACINNGNDLWIELGFGELADNTKVTATITLNEEDKYSDIQKARDIHYLDDRSLYTNDEVFANFRSLKGGNLKENFIYRSASPCDNQHNRAKYVDNLIKENNVGYIIDLADNDTKISGYIAKDDFDSDYFLSLYENNKVLPLALNMNFSSDYFKGQVALALKAIIENDGPFLVHCTEGKDRTGFMCVLIEALSGATYNEIVEDYMTTYFNYYAITKAFDDTRYTTIVENVLNPMIKEIVGNDVTLNKTTVLETNASNYLKQNNLLTDEEIAALKEALTGSSSTNYNITYENLRGATSPNTITSFNESSSEITLHC